MYVAHSSERLFATRKLERNPNPAGLHDGAKVAHVLRAILLPISVGTLCNSKLEMCSVSTNGERASPEHNQALI